MKRLLSLAVALLVLAGCGAPDDEGPRASPSVSVTPELPTDLPRLPVGHGNIRPGQQVHVPGMRADRVVAVPGGAFFLNGTELWFTDLVRARATDFLDVSSLIVSPDGRRIGFLDHSHGPTDAHGTHLILVIAYDARTGRPLASSYDGMGALAQDLAALYLSSRPRILGFAGNEMFVRGADGKRHQVRLGG